MRVLICERYAAEQSTAVQLFANASVWVQAKAHLLVDARGLVLMHRRLVVR